MCIVDRDIPARRPQGNAGPRCMTIKFALEAEAPGIGVWLDQDQRDKSEAGMMEGVAGARFFVLLLTQCIFSRWFCKLEIRRALALGKRIVLVRETDGRHGAAAELKAAELAALTVRCGVEKCSATATLGAGGAAWPCRCAAHTEEGMAEVALDAGRVGSDALSYSLIYGESGPLLPHVVDADALALATQILGMEGAPGSAVVASTPW